MTSILPLLLFFGSGSVGLVFEILWLRELGLLFGNTAHAAAATLGVFFAGLAAGGYWWGRWVKNSANPLRWYGSLEILVGLSALLFFALYPLLGALYSALGAWAAGHAAVSLALKGLLSLTLLFPPAFFMGGTLPALAEFFVRDTAHLGRKGTLLYAVNTAGAALGALAAGFYLPMKFGYQQSYWLAAAAACAIGVCAWGLGALAPRESVAQAMPGRACAGARVSRLVWLAAFASGFVTLGLQVLWTRMFAQVVQNSVYSFAAILIVFLCALAGGAFVAHLLCRLPLPRRVALSWLLIAGAFYAGLSSHRFYELTGGLQFLHLRSGWGEYIPALFGSVFQIVFVPALLLGTVFPYLMEHASARGAAAGETIGRLAAVNTLGAAAGSVCAGFAGMPLLGLWGSIYALAAAYFVLAALVAGGGGMSLRMQLLLRALPLGCLLFFSMRWDHTKFALLRPEPLEEVWETWQGPHGVVSVTAKWEFRRWARFAVPHGMGSGQLSLRELRLKLDNYYMLSSSNIECVEYQQMQSHIPLLMHPRPDKVFYIGLATGISSGASVDHPVKEITITELIPDVVKAADKYFKPYNNDILHYPKARLVMEDGRTYLRASRETYDVVIGDLFVPWHAGTGALYSREHFQSIYDHLNDGGLYAQWLPMYQLSEAEFKIIARTITEVFEQVTLWRGDYFPMNPCMALIAHKNPAPLDAALVVKNLERLKNFRETCRSLPGKLVSHPAGPFAMYVGNLTALRDWYADAPVNTDDRPLIEFLSPMSERAVSAEGKGWMNSSALMEFFELCMSAPGPEADPFLAALSAEQKGYVRAGLDYYKKSLYQETGDRAEAEYYFEEFRKKIPADFFTDVE